MSGNEQYVEDTTLTAIAVAYSNPAYTLIADQVLPRVTVGGLKFSYQDYNLADHFTVPDTRVGRRSSVNMVEMEGSEQTSKCEDFGIGIPLDNDTIKEAEKKGFDPRRGATERSTNILLLDREIRAAGIIFDPANYHADNKVQLAGNDQFSDFANSTPISTITQYLDACLMRPNKLVFGQTAWTKVSQHPEIVSAVQGNSGDKGIATRQAVANLFEVQEVHVGTGRVNSNKPGQAVSLARVWGNHVAGLFIDPTVTAETGGITFGFTAQYGDRVGGTKQLDIGLRGGVAVRAGETVKELTIANRAGFFIEDAVA